MSVHMLKTRSSFLRFLCRMDAAPTPAHSYPNVSLAILHFLSNLLRSSARMLSSSSILSMPSRSTHW